MITNENNQTSIECRVGELGEENELLLLQLHQVQEELEHYLRKDGSGDVPPSGSPRSRAEVPVWVDDKLADVLAENQRLRAFVDIQQGVYRIESQKALNVTLGNLLIRGVDSPKALLRLPGKLARIWKAYSKQSAPESLGGKSFGKVIAAYSEGGFGVVEKLLEDALVSPVVQANALTALARHLSSGAQAEAAEAARQAYELDPKTYRLKWLAFRFHEAGKVVDAEAMLAVLPLGTQFSDSEARQAKQLRAEAKHARGLKAKQDTQYAECRAEVERELNRLARERDEIHRELAVRNKEIALLNQTATKLEREKVAFARQHQEAVRNAADRLHEVEVLTQIRGELEQRNQALIAKSENAERQTAEYKQDVEARKAQLEQECFALTERYEESLKHGDETGQKK